MEGLVVVVGRVVVDVVVAMVVVGAGTRMVGVTVPGALVLAAEVATIVDRGGLVEGATVSVDSVSAAVDVIGAVPTIEVLDGAVDGTVVRSS